MAVLCPWTSDFDNRLRPAKSDFFDLDYTDRIAPRVLDERIHFLINDMLKDVVQQGTAKKAKSLGRQDLAGKTGTTNDQVDAWFNGYQKNLVASVWVGFDQPKTLGRAEYGGRAALPIWIEFMKHALDRVPEETPCHCQRASLRHGLIRKPAQKHVARKINSMREFFLLENPPKDAAPEAVIPSNDGQPIQTPQQLF